MTGTSGFKGGGLYAQNQQAGSTTLVLDGSGDGTTSVVFKKAMETTPTVLLTAQTGLTTGVLSVSNPTELGFIVKVDGSNITSNVIKVGYFAFDDTYY